MMKRPIVSNNILNRTDISVLECQRANLNKYHHQLDYDSNLAVSLSDPINRSTSSPDAAWGNGWFGFGFGFGSQQVDYGSAAEDKETPSISSVIGNIKKRKLKSIKGVGALMGEVEKEKKNKKMIRGFEEEENEEEKSKITEENIGSTQSITKKKKVTKENQNSSNDSSKGDYIHVRARRGQATDSHSLAERVRREKISERMKFLQDLVPGCNKITGEAGILDEIINYVQSLQRQVEYLSMKLAVVYPRLDTDGGIDIFGKEVIPDQTTNLTNVVMPSHDVVHSGYIQSNTMQQMVQSSGTETTNTFVLDPNVEARPMWDEMENLYSIFQFDQGQPSTTFTNSQPFSGSLNAN